MDNYIGKRVGSRYDIISLIGSGGMSNIYKATDTASEKIVAVKFLKEEFFENTELVRRFKNESKAIALLNHPNIIKVIDVNIDDKEKYIVVEYVNGITLGDYIDKNGMIPARETAEIIKIILPALSHAHEHGIIHRDIKPENIMITHDGKLKIMDFGIARLATSTQRTATDKTIGSVHYISPEQVRGHNTDVRSDIYSLGIMMYEMLTGEYPFNDENAVAVAMKHISDEMPSPRDKNNSIPEGMEQIVLKATNKEPSKRYQSAIEMLLEIEKFIKNPNIVFGSDKKKTEQAEKNKKPAKEKKKFKFTLKHMFILTCCVFISSLITCYAIFKYNGSPLFNNYENIELPNLIGSTIESTKAAGYKFKFDVTYVYSSEYAEGQIVYQAPKPPKTVKENSTIKVRVSQGPQSEWMPNLKGYSSAEAQKFLNELGVNVFIVMEDHKSVKAGHVIKTEPETGKYVTAGDKVTLYISRGDGDYINMVPVPNVVGLSNLSDVRKILSKNSLRLGTYVEQYHDEIAPGIIFEQAPAAGSEIMAGSGIDVLISKGPEPCAECESTEHKTEDHPLCEFCESKEHLTKEHECEKCLYLGEHLAEDCPYCPDHEYKHLAGECPWCKIHNDKTHLEGECPWCQIHGENTHLEGQCPPEPTPTPEATPEPTPEATPAPTPTPETTPTPENTPDISGSSGGSEGSNSQ